MPPSLLLWKLGFSRLNSLLRNTNLKNSGSWKPAAWLQSLCSLSKVVSAPQREAGAFPTGKPLKTELLLPVKLETAPADLHVVSAVPENGGCWFSNPSNAPLRHGVQPEQKRDNTANYTSIVWKTHTATKEKDEESRVDVKCWPRTVEKTQVADYYRQLHLNFFGSHIWFSGSIAGNSVTPGCRILKRLQKISAEGPFLLINHLPVSLCHLKTEIEAQRVEGSRREQWSKQVAEFPRE